MGLSFAIDELYASGWVPGAEDGHEVDDAGRVYPDEQTINQAFAKQGYRLESKHVQLFNCYRAEWFDAADQPVGAVVGKSLAEATVFAFSQLRRRMNARVPADATA